MAKKEIASTSIRMDKELRDILKKQAIKQGRSQNSYITHMLDLIVRNPENVITSDTKLQVLLDDLIAQKKNTN